MSPLVKDEKGAFIPQDELTKVGMAETQQSAGNQASQACQTMCCSDGVYASRMNPKTHPLIQNGVIHVSLCCDCIDPCRLHILQI